MSARSLRTSSVGRFRPGPSSAIALKYAVVPALSIWIGVTLRRRASRRRPSAASASADRRRAGRSGGRRPEEPPAEEPEDADAPRKPSAILDAGAWAGVPSETAMSSGPLTPGAEALREQVVGPARGGRGRQGRGVLLAEGERQQRDPQRQQDRQRREPGEQRVPARSRSPSRPQPCFVSRSGRSSRWRRAHAQRVDVPADDREHRPAAA